MDKFLEKISSYNLLNNLLPGAVFCYLLKYYISINLISEELIGNLFIFYFCGMVISRIGSTIIEPFYKKAKIVTFAEYGNFIKASGLDPKVDTLSETNNTYRTFVALFFIIGILKLYIYFADIYKVLSDIAPALALFSLFLLFSFSYRKQVNYIKSRVEHVCNNQNKDLKL